MTGGPGGTGAPLVDVAEARPRVLALAAARPPLLVVSDFDGTLSRIAPEPTAAAILPAARRALRRLAAVAERRPGRLAIAMLSGRTAADLAGRVRVGGLRYLGNHGIEAGSLPRRGRPEALDPALDAAHAPLVARAASVGEAVADRLGRPAWLILEPKGPSIGIHYRQAPDPEAARAAILEALDREAAAGRSAGLARLESRRIVELRPDGAGGKGAAVAGLLDELRPGAALVIGDDRTDADAFRALRQRREAEVLAGLALGVHGGSELPAEIAATADLLVPSPEAAARLLAALAGALEREAG